MSGETEQSVSGWTVDTLFFHIRALRTMDDKFEQERDRRITEVGVEREKALKIKETADLAALSLARDIQIYKDEKANELRTQIERERGSYATQIELRAAVERMEVVIKPLGDFVARSQGRASGLDKGWAYLVAAAALGLSIYAATKGG